MMRSPKQRVAPTIATGATETRVHALEAPGAPTGLQAVAAERAGAGPVALVDTEESVRMLGEVLPLEVRGPS